ncbi:type II toxin-antitoxin system RelE/ParE family toxin [Schaalia odontolytica]|uniref:type II toxin-antitoxin system RelE/ParE family toxin n=1 Tax=Schaalia odontolytica TaxID=1660 RepID=UPI001F52A67F|nr:type II toxin-antitoxin system RelE/ParE family toxin [Schaalia odontolytica]
MLAPAEVRGSSLGTFCIALRKLRQIDAACRLEDLRIPPGNRLERLRGNRAGQYSIRINDQWRICFRWGDAGPEGVEIVHGKRGITADTAMRLSR